MLIKFNRPRLLGFNGKLIVPGINDLPAEFVAQMQEDSILAGKFDDGELEIIGRDDIGAGSIKVKKGQKTSGVDILLAANEREARKLAAQTIDVGILELWLKREKRIPVRKSIKVQLSKIKNIEYRKSDSPQTELTEE